jgi:hypothetical protein
VIRVSFGTAHLFGLVDRATSEVLLQTAWECGIRQYDTAPSYGRGASEAAVGRFLGGRPDVDVVTTKVGLEPLPGSARTWEALGRAARRTLPRRVTERLRRAVHARGHFEVDDVRTSVDRSLRRLNGRIDRLLLHEVTVPDITGELLGLLDRYRRDGDVGELGVATENRFTTPVVALGGDLFSVVHVAVGPCDEPVALPSSVKTRVGHGLLGSGGRQLLQLRTVLELGGEVAEAWQTATADTSFAGAPGLGRALLARAPSAQVTEVIVATSRQARVAETYALASGRDQLPVPVRQALGRLVSAATAAR